MVWINRLEKIGRLLLWLALAVTIALVPIGLARVERVNAATKTSESKLAELEKAYSDKTARITYASIGNGLTLLNTENAIGHLWFTNVSPRAGYVCVSGVATNGITHASTKSLPACAEVSPYASAVHLTVMFAGGDLSAVCKAGPCSLRMTDAASSEP